MSDSEKKEAKAMMNVYDADGNRVTGDLKPGDYKLVLETENLLAAVGPSAYIALAISLRIDDGDFVTLHTEKVVPSKGEENAELPFSIDKWMKRIFAIAMLHTGNKDFQGYLFWDDKLEKKVTSQYPSHPQTI